MDSAYKTDTFSVVFTVTAICCLLQILITLRVWIKISQADLQAEDDEDKNSFF